MLTLQSKPSARTDRARKSPAGPEAAAGPGEAAGGIAKTDGRQSSEAGAAAAEGGMQSGPEQRLLVWRERCGRA